MTSTMPEDRIELRLALVCYGGVSLAIYMHGVTKELHKLVRASRWADAHPTGDNPFGPEESERAYVDALRAIAAGGRPLSVSIDVIAGTSAGGINGVVLGKALAVDGDQEGLKELWIKEGDLRTLLRGLPVGGLRFRAATAVVKLLGRLKTATSPLKGELMSRLLLHAIEDIDPEEQGTLLPEQGTLDLYVTLTDLDGFEVLVPTGAGGASQRDRQHAQVLRFAVTEGDTAALGKESCANLAFAARATSSFPGAFKPVGIGSFAQECGITTDRLTLDDHFVSSYTEQGRSAAEAWFVDGGVLDNAPFDHVIEAIARKRAQSEVRRRILYIQPDPGDPLLPPKGIGAAPDTTDGPTPKEPAYMDALWRVLWDVKASHSVLRDLLALRDLNARIAQVGDIAEQQETAVFGQVEGAVQAAAATWRIKDKDTVQQVSDEMHERAQSQLGAGWPTYCRLKVEAAAHRWADEIADRCHFPPDSSRRNFIQVVTGAWARSTEVWKDPTAAGLPEWLRPVDLPYRERRLNFLLAGVNALYKKVGAEPGTPKLHDLNDLKGTAWDLLDTLRTVPGETVANLPDGLVAFLNEPRITPCLLDDPEQFAAEHKDEFHALFTAYSAGLEGALGDGGTPLWQAFETTTRAWDDDHRVALLGRYLGFPLWDGLIFPTIALSALPQFTPIGVAQFSPEAAKALRSVEKKKLKGIPLHHFAAFLEAEYRENDYLWGRLDAAELILRTLFDAGSADPSAAATTPPRTQPDAVRSAGGPLLQDALRAVLESETGLGRIGPRREELLHQVNGLLAEPVAGPPAPRGTSEVVEPA